MGELNEKNIQHKVKFYSNEVLLWRISLFKIKIQYLRFILQQGELVTITYQRFIIIFTVTSRASALLSFALLKE